MLPAAVIDEFFAWAPLTVFIVIVVVVYFMARTEPHAAAPIGKTYSCARCGRRGSVQSMVSVAHEGAVVWYCRHCAS